ncbi:MAG: chemotaxis protein CheX [Phycisphaerae bacterium]|nr:chemotaxis protein CheX [Phycisphaerae bacterium]
MIRMITEICFEKVLLESAQEVFEMMIFMSVEQCPDCVTVEGDSLLGSITFTGSIEGCMAICCSLDCAKTIACNMLAIESDDGITENEIRDAIGEIANMLLGSIKANLIKKNIGNLDVSIPCVVSGKELTSSLGENAVEITLPIYIDEAVAELTLQYRIVR